MAELLVFQSKVRQVAKKKGMRFSENALPTLSKIVEQLVIKACERAKANKRKTLMPNDF
jgi:histone H3/H4